jgi:hypothetical protein
MTFVLAAFAHIEGTRPGASELRSIRCLPGGSGDSAEWILRSEPTDRVDGSLGAGPELFALAGALASRWGGSLRTTTTGFGTRESRVALGAALAS